LSHPYFQSFFFLFLFFGSTEVWHLLGRRSTAWATLPALFLFWVFLR
jgi:hypothetical protein